MKRNTKLQTVLERIKLVLALAAMLGITYLFTFYLDADVGVVVFAFLLFAPLLSALLAWAASRRIHMFLTAPDTVQKGRHFQVSAVTQAEGRLPIPFVRLHLLSDANFLADDDRMIQSAMTPAEALEVAAGYTAQHAGNAAIWAAVCGNSRHSSGWGSFPLSRP